MDEQWNGLDEQMTPEQLVELEAAREEFRKRETKAEAKRWREIPFPLNLSDALARLTKDELSAVRASLDIRNASSLNKHDLVDLLSKQVPVLIQATLKKLDEERYGVLKRIADSDGQAFVPLDPHEYAYFQRRGLAFTGTVDGKRTLVMPEEVLREFKLADGPSLRATMRKHTEWLQISQGLLFYYGFLSTGDMVGMVEAYSGGKVDVYEFLTVVWDAAGYNCPIHADYHGFAHEDVRDVPRVIREQGSRPDVPFYPFTKAQVVRAGKTGFVDRTPAYKAFVEFLKRSYQIDSAEAEDEAEFCVYEIQTGEPLGNIINDITEVFEIPTMDVLQALTHYISELNNNTRQWFLKGHTPRELLPADVAAMRRLPTSKLAPKGEVIDITTKKKVGRNDPCPCGSGKKYKKCCGR